MSLSARRAWIEIRQFGRRPRTRYVALRKESVDRNGQNYECFEWIKVVALRKESVDRNVPGQNLINGIGLSLSARRAWIEITRPSITRYFFDSRSPQGERG